MCMVMLCMEFVFLNGVVWIVNHGRFVTDINL